MCTLLETTTPGLGIDRYALMDEIVLERNALQLSLIEEGISQPDCIKKKLLKYQNKLQFIAQRLCSMKGAEWAQIKILELSSRITSKINSEINYIVQKFFSLGGKKTNLIHQRVLRRAYPEVAKEISDFIRRTKLDFCRRGVYTGKSIELSFSPSLGTSVLIKYRLQNGKPQILVLQKIQEGTFESVQKAAVIAGPLIVGAPSRIFARLKLKEEWKNNPSVVGFVRNESYISRNLCWNGAKNIVWYSIISERKKGATLASVLYKEDLYQFLCRSSHGANTLKDISAFLSDIAIPIARALCSLHENGLVHLDLKPENILLPEQGKACLGDFGSCQEEFSWYSGILTPTLVAAPEIFENQGMWEARPSLDMWAFGLLLANLFLGLRKGRVSCLSEQQLATQSLEQKIALIKSGASKIVDNFDYKLPQSILPARLCTLAIKLLSLNPTERPTARLSLKELQAALDALPRNRCFS